MLYAVYKGIIMLTFVNILRFVLKNNMIRTIKQYDTGLARAIRIINGITTQDTEDSVVNPLLLTRSFRIHVVLSSRR